MRKRWTNEIDTQTGAASAVMQWLYRSVVVKKEQSFIGEDLKIFLFPHSPMVISFGRRKTGDTSEELWFSAARGTPCTFLSYEIKEGD